MSETTDPVVFGLIGRVFIVRWKSPLVDEATARVMAAMINARREAGASIVNISILPPEAGEPTVERSASIQARLPLTSHLCEAIYVVLPIGSSTRERWMRYAATTETITSMSIEVCDSPRQACERAAARLGLNAGELFDAACVRGLMINEPAANAWRDAYPEVARYLDQLPAGWSSYPSRRAASLLVRWMEKRGAFDELPPLPAPLERVRRQAAENQLGDWVPEIMYVALVLAVQERSFPGDEHRFLEWFTEASVQRISAVQGDHELEVDLDTLLRGAADLWERYHSGMTSTSERLEANAAVVSIEYPAALFPPLMIRAFARMGEIAFVRLDAPGTTVSTETTEVANGHVQTRFIARWTASTGP